MVQGQNVAVSAALSQVGKPYVWDTPLNPATSNPDSFDCSGLTMWAWYQAGIHIDHYTGAQWAETKKRPLSQAQPGDLIFYGTPPYHVAMVTEPGQLIEAPTQGVPVRVRSYSPTERDIHSHVGVYSPKIGGSGFVQGASSGPRPPYVVRMAPGSNDLTQARIAGKWYNGETSSTNVPAYAVTRMANYIIKVNGPATTNTPGDESAQAQYWLNHRATLPKGPAPAGPIGADVLIAYTYVAKPEYNTPGLPGSGTGKAIGNAGTSIGHFLAQLGNGELWVRVAEFSVGGILIAVAARKVLETK